MTAPGTRPGNGPSNEPGNDPGTGRGNGPANDRGNGPSNEPGNGPSNGHADAGPLLTSRARGVVFVGTGPSPTTTYLVTQPPPGHPRSRGAQVAVKIPGSAEEAAAVEHEGRMLVELRRMPLGTLGATIPRYVRTLQHEGRPVLVSSVVPGEPMRPGHHHRRQTTRRRHVRRDLRMAATWLAELQSATARRPEPVTWASETTQALARRWDGHARLLPALGALAGPRRALSRLTVEGCAVHGDFTYQNLLVDAVRVTGVVDWAHGEPVGSPLRDLARFPLAYALNLDPHLERHRGAGPTVADLGGTGACFGRGVRYALLGSGWLPNAVRGFLVDGLVRLGLPSGCWYAVALTGLAELAATAGDPHQGARYLDLLAGMPQDRHRVPAPGVDRRPGRPPAQPERPPFPRQRRSPE